MIYNNADIRRQDRLLDEASATNLLDKGEYGVLSMIDEKGMAYGVPLNFVWDKQGSLYVHCAPSGRKLQAVQLNKIVSFCVVGKTNVLSHLFTTEYESIVLQCSVEMPRNDEEKMNALLLLATKYNPQASIEGRNYAEKSFARTQILRLDIQQWSGKSKKARNE